MSWSFVLAQPVDRDVLGEELRAAKETYFKQGGWLNSDVLVESSDDADLGIEAALLLARGGRSAGCLGMSNQVTASISGHSNPGHGKREGWADETITVSVRDA